MLNKLLDNLFLKEGLFKFVNFPLISFLYRQIYKFNIEHKLKNFKLSDLTVSIEPSNVCNSKCRMCPYPTMNRPKVIMSMELFSKIVNDCIQEGIRSFNLNFYNEPFLDPQIFERIKFIKSKKARVQLFSNASVINKECAEKILSSGLDRIDLSIDGVKKETYESIRVGLNWETVQANILYLIKRKKELNLKSPKIRVIFVRQESNKAEVNEFINFWQGKADRVIISSDDNRNDTSSFFNKTNVSKKAFPCKRLWSELIVMSNGKVPLCCIDADGEVNLGDFNIAKLKEIWNSEKFKQIRKLHLDFKADRISLCRSCVHPFRMNLKSWW
ncbi:MAG: hypothetical protein UT86_C0001G0020 [Candidatus Magasanikbacteria bacterium GW2011_GWC2_40_17]|uniref:Radical SAM domain protein n=1 Tax=Candidatus Magasanikbacteria bacterium GW2011_GWA2_42_32 TaxID=1619039 RepID=A0A0G1A8M0_9BACT|nr:MAG: hypothetical protein UT86_C0001G0020 [Candidatus Magasanikbacteria bacterium GW2011_GWC2_40_17]KKS57380.1 MAG: hypothetical protein UV20_C0001G0020 [Candidatus Magasanikbacteria bacterium GW2011_GWA2_42_32]